MLRRLDSAGAPALPSLLKNQPELSVRILSLWRAYGTDSSFFAVWLQDDGRACLARLDGTFFLVDADGADCEEIAFFLRFNPYFSALTAELSLVRRVARYLPPDGSFSIRHLLRQENSFPVFPSVGSIERKPALRTVFNLVSAYFPVAGRFDAWYADLSHRIRHGCADAYLLCIKGEPAGACLVSARSGRAGLISSVVTRPAFRGRGVARSLLSAAVCDLTAGGCIPVLECRTELLDFYQRLGFRECGRTAEWHK